MSYSAMQMYLHEQTWTDNVDYQAHQSNRL